MSLQSRLFLFFTIVVVIPLGVAGYLAQRAVSNVVQVRDNERVGLSTPGVVWLYTQRVAELDAPVSALAADSDFKKFLVAGDSAGMASIMRRYASGKPGAPDFAFVADPQGHVVAQVPGVPNYLPGTPVPTLADMLVTDQAATTKAGPGLLVSRILVQVVSGTPPAPVGTLVAGDYLDNHFAAQLNRATGVDVTIVVNGQAVASSIPTAATATKPWMVPIGGIARDPVKMTVGGRIVDATVNQLVQTAGPRDGALVVSTPPLAQDTTRGILASIVVVLLLAGAGAAMLGFAVARAIARPLRELAGGADAIAAGNYDQHIEVRSGDDVGQLARAFNEMTRRLGAQFGELQESREELRRSLARFGETLRSTHDLDKILQVVLDTSVDALRASGGVLTVVDPEEGKLTVAAARGVDAEQLRLKPGEGIAGTVAVTGEPVRLPNGLGTKDPKKLPDPSPVEPPFESAIWVPVFAQGRIFAVLSLYDREDEETFTARDLDTVLSLADQAGVAIDNVVLHQEAQRLAITDGLTGIWNHRYFQLRFDQEIDRSARFRRPFCLLLCDIDDFKRVNDTYGHLTGNGVLTDLARRVKSEIRDIDVLARYGGEEFALLLPETDADGGFRAAEKIRRRIAESPFCKDRDIPVTISIGVAAFPRAGTDQTSVLRAADVALYRAKAMGKNRTVVFQSSDEGPGELRSAGTA